MLRIKFVSVLEDQVIFFPLLFVFQDRFETFLNELEKQKRDKMEQVT